MTTLQDAINKIKARNKEEIIGIYETDDRYIFFLKNGAEGASTVNKSNGNVDFIWIWDYGALVKANKVKKVMQKSNTTVEKVTLVQPSPNM